MSDLDNNIKRLMSELGMNYEQAKKAAEMNAMAARMAEHSTMSDDDVDALVMGCHGACVGGKCHD